MTAYIGEFLGRVIHSEINNVILYIFFCGLFTGGVQQILSNPLTC
ncbi:hypothetical protein CFREI_00850 [Corynebacterium freiburgense]|nr:hypothetical protein CFREI_00850 [Corynebacterium freiburgense]